MMDVTPKSKQPGSLLKRRPSGLSSFNSRSTRTKLLKPDDRSPPAEKSRILEESTESSVSASEQQCTPVRQSVLKNEMSPQYPHLFRINDDDSPEFRVGWVDGVSGSLPRKENTYLESSITCRSIISQHMRRPTKRIATPPRLKQHLKTADVMEYMEWTKNLVMEAQTPSPSELLAANSAEGISGCVKVEDAVTVKETASLSRRSLPVSTIGMKENLELNRKSLPTESNFSNFFDDSANDDMFMKCSQAVEDSLLKDKQTHQITSSKLVNNNNIVSVKGAQPKQRQSNPARPNTSGQVPHQSKSNCISSNKFPTYKLPSQAANISNKVQIPATASVKPPQHVSATARPGASTVIPSKLSSEQNSSPNSEPPASSRELRTDIDLLDEDEEFLTSLDLQSLSQMNLPQSAIPSNNNSSGGCSAAPNPSSNTNAAAKVNQSATVSVASRKIVSLPASSNISNRTTNQNQRVTAHTGKICTQEAIKRKREEAQRRLKSKMMRHDTL
nr:PREDICTED: uncharacterized protein LOC109032411 [Bemisia tabaci]